MDTDVVVVGAGPVGLWIALRLARQGRSVVLVDRSPAPPPEGPWRRRGVMQFQHPHFFRMQVRRAFQDHLPDVWEALLAAGGVEARIVWAPEEMAGLACRRSVLERVLWEAAAAEPGVTLRTGLAEELVVSGGSVSGVVVDGEAMATTTVICATGRGSRFADAYRAPGEESDCGFSYVSRMYQALPGVAAPTGGPVGAVYDGYLAMVFPQDDGTLSALVVRPTAEQALDGLMRRDGFDAAVARIPTLAPWTDPSSFTPITDVLVGGRLTNGYRGQRDERGQIAVAGLFFVGDAVCTTNPSAGRGVTLGLEQATALLPLLVQEDLPARRAAELFDDWCLEHLEPWYRDHVLWDADLLSRMAGNDIDPEGQLASDVVCAAGEEDPSLMPVIGPFLGMLTGPQSLEAVHERVRELLRQGWRPGIADGPAAAELAHVMKGEAAAVH